MTELPASGSGFLFVTSPADPAAIGSLPSYAEQLIAEVTVSGVISITSKYPDIKGSHQADPSGYWREDSIHGCYVKIVVTYSVQGAAWTPACSINPFQSTRTDSILVKGEGTIKRTGAIAQWPYECYYDSCWEYAGEQSYSITPIPVPLNLTTPLTAEASPGVIYLPPPGNWTLFKIVANPARLKSIDVPIRVISWQWTAATGGPGQTVLTGDATAIQRSVYITEPGAMVVNAVVNGVEQVDFVTVVSDLVRLQPASMQMLPSIRTAARNDVRKQEISVSVVSATGVIRPNRDVLLGLAATENTAGHLHGVGKPAGELDLLEVNTGPNGVVTVTFTAPDPSGPIDVMGSSTGAAPVIVTIDVGVLGLGEFGPGANYDLTGDKPAHPSNHWGTSSHITILVNLANRFYAKFGSKLTFNDTSLPLGGLYDVGSAAWATPHKGHREGMQTDVRTIDLTAKQMIFVQEEWKKLAGKPVYDETATSSPHYHLPTVN